MTQLEETVKDIVLGKIDLPLENVGFLFFANGSNELISANIAVESVLSKMSLDDYSEAATRGAKEALSSWEVGGVSRIDVGGRTTMLSTASYDASELNIGITGVIRLTQLMLVQGRVASIVTCGFPEEADFAESCESIVRTFRILE